MLYIYMQLLPMEGVLTVKYFRRNTLKSGLTTLALAGLKVCMASLALNNCLAWLQSWTLNIFWSGLKFEIIFSFEFSISDWLFSYHWLILITLQNITKQLAHAPKYLVAGNTLPRYLFINLICKVSRHLFFTNINFAHQNIESLSFQNVILIIIKLHLSGLAMDCLPELTIANMCCVTGQFWSEQLIMFNIYIPPNSIKSHWITEVTTALSCSGDFFYFNNV